MAISETLALVDRVTSPAAKMSRAMERLTRATDDYRKAEGAIKKEGAAKRIDAEVGAIKRMHAAQDKAGARTLALQRKQAQTQERAVARHRAAQGRAAREQQAAFKKQNASASQTITRTLGVVAAVTAVGVAALSAAAKVAKLGVEFISNVADAHAARGAAEGMMRALGASDAPAALKALDNLSLQLGMSLEDGRAQFIALGKAGKSASEIAAIMKLRADLVAVTGSAELADEKLKKVLDAKSGGDTAKALAALRKETGVAGDGVAALNKRMNTFGGFVGRLKQAPARIFDQLAQSSGKALDELGTKLNKALDDLLRSPEAAAAVQAITLALDGVLSAAIKIAPLIMPFLKGFSAALKPVVSALAPIGKAIMSAFGGSSGDAMKTAERLGKALGVTLTILGGLAVAALTPVVGPIILIAGVLGKAAAAAGRLTAQAAMMAVGLPAAISSAVARGKAALDLLIDSARSAASQMISGLVSGITGGAARVVAAVRQLGASVKGALASVLQIRSPSKVMQRLGGHISGGLAKGIDAGAGKAAGASADMGAMSASGAAGGAASGGVGASVTVNINVSAQPGATRADGAALAEGMMPLVRREMAAMLSGRAMEAT